MWYYKITWFHGFPRAGHHLASWSIRSSISLYLACSKCTFVLQIWYAISLFLTFFHSRRYTCILIIKVWGVSIHLVISYIVSWVISWIWSLVVAKYILISSNFSFGGSAWSIRSKNGMSRKPSKVSAANHLHLHAIYPYLMMDSTISMMLSQVSIMTLVFLV